MKKNNKDFREIQIIKERQKLRILEQELKIKSSFRELGGNLTGSAIKTRIREKLSSGSGLATKLGLMAVSLLINRFRRKRKK